jgi:hypothetical protein
MAEVQCNCGAIRIELQGAGRLHYFCHCDDCQAVHGAAYIPVALYDALAVKVTRGNPGLWTLRRLPRTSCRDCGTRLFSEIAPLGARGVTGSLLPRGAFKPTFHMQCQFAVRPIRDDLPHYKGFPAAFGGSDELVEW